jgi:hypothetical protein
MLLPRQFCVTVPDVIIEAEANDMKENSSSREEEWEDLFDNLSDALAKFGNISTIGGVDFWLIDDDWGGHHHKIEVINAKSWSNDVRQAISQVLAAFHPNWGVYIDFEDGSDDENFIVYADGVETTPRWP